MPSITKLKARLLAEKGDRDRKIPDYVIGAECGVSPSELAAYATGRKPITARHLVTLAEYFGIDANDLVGTYEYAVHDSGAPTD